MTPPVAAPPPSATTTRTEPTADWRRWRARARVWDPPAVPTVVVVPHPDDEVLLFGGFIHRQARRGVPVTVVAVTDGEAAYPSLVSPGELAARREIEQRRALHLLGANLADVVRLRFPDGRVAGHERRLQVALDGIIAGAIAGDGLIVCPWLGDHHCDHEATGRAVAAAAARRAVPAAFGLFWAWTKGDPGSPRFTEMLRLDLTEHERHARQQAMSCHRSQLTDELAPPLLRTADLEPLTWEAEHYVLAGPA